MPQIVPTTDLSKHYNQISALCHQCDEPVFITKDGEVDLAVLSINAYEKLCGKLELYRLLEVGLNDEKEGRISSFDEAMTEIRHSINP